MLAPRILAWVGLAILAVGVPAEASNTGYMTSSVLVNAGACWAGFTIPNVGASDNVWASCAAGTNNGRVSTFGFGIPGTATIDGIQVEVEGNDGTGATVNYTVEISWDTGTTWIAKTGSFTGAADTTTVLGGTADTWGRTWTTAETADPTFQLRIRRTSGGTLRVDRIRVAIEYTIPPANLTQGHYRWRNDDGTEVTATWAAPQDVALVAVPRMTLRRLRFEVSNEGGATATGIEYQLQVAQSDNCATASYQAPPIDYLPGPGDWEVADSWLFADQDPTTNVAGGLTDEATTFVAGMLKDSGNYTVGGITLAGDQFTEVEFAVRAKASAVTGANYCFRLYDRTNNRVLDTYSTYAQATVAGAGPTRVRTGSYVGNGTSGRAISVGFRPDVVIVKGNLDEYAVIKTATMTASRSIFYDNGNPHSDAIRSLDANGFTVGADVKVNSSAVTYYWTAFQAGSGEMAIGTYDGNDADNRDIAGLGFQPEYVVTMSENASWANHRFAAQVGDLSMTVEGGVLGPNRIQALLADGFQVGTDGDVNEGSPVTRFHWVAFNHVPGRVHISSYTGNGGASQAITAPGFPPEYVLLSPEQNSPAYQKPASVGATSNLSHAWGGYPAASNVTDVIQTVLPNGFQVGNDNDANQAATAYYYLAFAAARLEQVHTRWRNDDGSEAAATWAAAQDTPITGLSVGTKRRLRFEVSNEGGVTSDATSYELQVALATTCATGTYTTVSTGAGGPWQVVDSTFLTDAAASTNVAGGLTDEGTTFVAGQVKDAGSTTGAITLAANEFTEIEFALQATANASPGGTYCFRLYDATYARPLDGYVYAQASLPSLTLADHPAGQVGDQFSTTTPVTSTLFQFRLSRAGTVSVDNVRVRFTTGSGVANGDVSAGELWEDTNGNGIFDGAGPDTLLQGAVAPVAGVLTFTSNFTPLVAGTNYFVRATVANLASGDTTTFSLGAADIDEVEAGIGEPGAISNAVHTQDYSTGGDVYYSVGTSAADLKTGNPNITISNGTATLSVAQTGYVGVGDEITFTGPTRVFIKAVLGPTLFVVHTPTGAQPANVAIPQAVTSIRRAFNSITAAESGSPGASYLTSANLSGNSRRLTWVCYNDGPFTVAPTTTIAGYTTDATYYITLTVAGASDTVLGASHRHDGTAGSGVVVEAGGIGGGNPVFNISQAFTRFEWLEIDGNSFVSQDGVYVNASNVLLRNLIVHHIGANDSTNCPNASNGCSGIIIAGATSGVQVRNSFVYDYGQDGIDAAGTGTVIANTTLFRTLQSGEGLQVTGGTVTAENVLSLSNNADYCAQDFCAGTLTCNNCMSSDGSGDNFPGTGSVINLTPANQLVSTTPGAVDLHLKYGADAIGAGKDLSGSFTDDIDGETRVAPWDVGADERQGSAGQMLVKTGTYTGNGTDNRAIYVGFQPDVVILKRDTGTSADDYHGVVRTSTMSGTKDLDFAGIALFAGGIKSLTPTGFVVGTDARVNSSLAYHWIAFKAAPGELKVGSYTGTGVDNRSVTGVGFSPDYVMLLPQAAQTPVHRTSGMTGDVSYDSDATNYIDRIQAFEADGFQVGLNAGVNQNGGTFHYVAWNNTPGRVAIGTYAGNGVPNSGTTQQIGVGFAPEWVLIRRNDNTRPWVHKPASTGVNTNYSMYLADFIGTNNDIQFLQASGFQVIAQGEGATDRVNQTGVTYHFAAFGPHATTTNYRAIGTAAPYSTGTIEAASGSVTITGAGTTWVAANRGRGDVITIPCNNPPTCTGGTHYTVLSVDSNTSLTLTGAFTGASSSGLSYLIRRQFTTLAAWESCIDASGACGYFPVASSSLVADDRKEVGIAYKDSTFVLGANLQIDGSTTDAAHDITLTADPGNRHHGVAGNGVILDLGGFSISAPDAYVTFEWLELRNGSPRGFHLSTPNATPNNKVIRNCLFASSVGAPISWFATGIAAQIYNNIFIGSDPAIDVDASTVTIYNNTFFNLVSNAVVSNAGSNVTLRNNLALGCSGGCYTVTGLQSSSSNNIASDTTGTTHSPGGGGLDSSVATASPTSCPGGNCVGFTSITGGSENLHLISTTYTNRAVDTGVSLASIFFRDVDNQVRPLTGWDIGADERDATTAVKLAGFTARPFSGAVRVEWATASELDNLGFHLYRGLSASGPWIRLTQSLISGLGSSAQGRSYSWLDTGLSNGVRYFYRLEDVDNRSKVTSHGPVSAVPDAALADPTEGQREEDGAERADDKGRDTKTAMDACPAWVAAAYGETAPSDSAPLRCTRHGKPESVGLEVVSSSTRGAVLELRTDGFYAVHEADGSVRLFVPGFDTPADPTAPALPLRRALVDAVVGRTVVLQSAEPRDLVAYRGLTPAAVGVAEIEVSRQGAIRGARRAIRPARASRGYVPQDVARLLEPVFQGEVKSAVVELTPLRYDGGSGQLVLARRVRVQLSFAGRDLSETGRGRFGRKPKREEPPAYELLAQLHTTKRGLHAVSFAQLFPAGAPAIPMAHLRLQVQGASAAFRVEPQGASFGPGSVLYFHSSRLPASTDFSSEIAWELVRSSEGSPIAVASAAPTGPPVASPTGRAFLEADRMYVPGLADAPDVWLWDGCVSGGSVAKTFALPGLDASSPRDAELTVHLQGASESGLAVDHHIRLSLGGVPLGELRFAGKRAFSAVVPVPAGLLQEATNSLEILNVADTGVSSAVYLDRFAIAYPQLASLHQGQFEGTWAESGAATVEGASGPVALLDVTEEPARWLTGFELAPPVLRFEAQAGRHYLAVDATGLLAPRVQAPPASTLRSALNQADYLLIAPVAFLDAAQPLLERRQAQGLTTRAVAFEEIAQVFGHGRPSAEAVRDFLAFAFHSWSRPSPRYVLLLGDASYDPRNFMGTSKPAPLPALWAQTAFLWTVSDPALAAVNGDDLLPDLAIGRLSAGSVEQAQALVAKLLAWEDSGQGLTGRAAIVADNPDAGGDFEANARDIAQSFLADRSTSLLLLRELGAGTRPAIRDAFDAGLSLMSYVGHGAAALWANENIWNMRDYLSLRPQSQQPLLLTLNCLNGYFVPPGYDSLAESLVKAEGRGAIAAMAPSGLSIDGPAHQYHRALMSELTSGRHERLGDAIAAAQRTYAQTGLMPELLSLYHLFGDPATKIR